MKKRFIVGSIAGIMFMTIITGCVQNGEQGEPEIHARAPVTVTHIRTGMMSEYTELTATSAFLVRSVVQSPVNAYVEKCLVNPGDRVEKREVIFQLRTKEAEALKGDTTSALYFSGLVQVKSSLEGVISQIDHPRGDYVQEGNPLCSIVLPESLVFLLDVPFEARQYIHSGNSCVLLLPGDDRINARIKSAMPSVSGTSQTQRVILEPETHSLIPENLIARVNLPKNLKTNATILPRSCILSDEIMKNFWVMKLISDSIAVKVPVTTGLMTDDSIEIVSPRFLPADQILSSGNYGLSDTASVKVIDKVP